jgi:hypothetical protein
MKYNVCMLSGSASQALSLIFRVPRLLQILWSCDVVIDGDGNLEVAKNTEQWSYVSWHLPPSRIMQTTCSHTEHRMARSNAVVGACCCRQAPLERLPNPSSTATNSEFPQPLFLFPWPAKALRAFPPAQKHDPV